MVRGEKDPKEAYNLADKIHQASTSAEAAVKLMRDELMPGSAPLQVLQELAFLGEACVSADASSRPHMGCSPSDKESVVGRLAEIEQLLGGTTSSGSDPSGKEPPQVSVSVRQ